MAGTSMAQGWQDLGQTTFWAPLFTTKWIEPLANIESKAIMANTHAANSRLVAARDCVQQV